MFSRQPLVFSRQNDNLDKNLLAEHVVDDQPPDQANLMTGD